MSDFEGGKLRRRRRIQVPGRDAWFTWVGDEDPTEEDMDAMRALVDAAVANAETLTDQEPPQDD